ncbi:hypothetical protein GCK32_017915, partial [Trichostrongylus colubriformis]
HLQVGMGRRFRALKIYLVLLHLGAEYIREALRKQVRLAALFAELIASDKDFELFVPQHLGLVCFRISNSTNKENAALCNAIVKDRRVYLLPAKVGGELFIRLVICSALTTEDDIRFTFNLCKEILANTKTTSVILETQEVQEDIKNDQQQILSSES